MTKVVFLLVPGLHLLDLGGAAQAFGTAAGIASGIDLALHPIAVRDGPARAARVAREMVV